MDADEDANIPSTVEEMRQKRLAYFNAPKSKQHVNEWEILNPLSTVQGDADNGSRNENHLDGGQPFFESQDENPYHFHIHRDQQPNPTLHLEQVAAYDFKHRLENPKLSKQEPQYCTRGHDFPNKEPQPLKSRKGKIVQNSIDSDNSQLQLKDSQDVDGLSIFISHPNLEDLGLSTHRPESETSAREIQGELFIPTSQGSAKTTRQIFSEKSQEEMRLALGDEKMEELMLKVNADLGQLRHHNRSPRRRQRFTDDSKMAHPEQNGTRSSRSSSVDGFSPMVSGEKSIPKYRSRAGSQSPLRQPESKVPVNLQDGEKEVPVFVRNYDQITIPKNTRNSYSSEEIYRQAYGGFQEPEKYSLRRWSNASPDHPPQFDNRPFPISTRGRKPSVDNSGGNTAVPVSHYQNYNMMGSLPVSSIPPPHFDSHAHNSVPHSPHASFRSQGGPMPVFMPSSYHHPPPFYPDASGNAQLVYNSYGSQSPSASPSAMPMHNPFHYPSLPYPSHLGAPRFPESLPFHIHPPPPIPHQMARHAQPQSSLEQATKRNSFSLHGHPGYVQEISEDVPISASMKMPHPPTNPPAISRYEDASAKTRHSFEGRQLSVQSEPATVKDEKDFNSFNLQRYFSSIDLSPKEVDQNVAAATPQSSRSVDSDFPRSNNDDNMSSFTNVSEFTSATKAGGITNRLVDLGVNLDHLKHLWVVDSKNETDNKNDALSKLIRRCPECGTANKMYMMWCIECNESLIGVEASMPRGRQRQARTSNTENESSHNFATNHDSGKQKDLDQDGKSQFLKVDGDQEEGIYFRKDSPESGRGISLSSSPVRYRKDQEECVEPKDSGRASIGDLKEAASHAPQEVGESTNASEEFDNTEEVEYIYEDVEADIYEHISDPILRDFIISYRNRQELNMDPILNSCAVQDTVKNEKTNSRTNSLNHELKSFFPEEQRPLEKLNAHRMNESDISGTENRNKSDFSSTKDQGYECAPGNSYSEKIPDKSQPNTADLSKPKKSKKKRKHRCDAIDIEIFGYEETRRSRNSSRCENIVPMLNLVRSSEEESSEDDEDSDDSNSNDESDRVKTVESKLPQTLNTGTAKVRTNTAPKQIISSGDVIRKPLKSSTQASVSKSSLYKNPAAPSREMSSKFKPKGNNPIPASYQRRWARSSIAWSSYNTRELSTKSSIPVSSQPNVANGARPSSARLPQRRVNTPDESNLNSSSLPTRQRPASAEYGRRKPASTNTGQHVRPSSASYQGRQPVAFSGAKFSSSNSSTTHPSLSSHATSSESIPEYYSNNEPVRKGSQVTSMSHSFVNNGETIATREPPADNDSPRSLCSELHRLPDEEEDVPSDKMHAIAKTAYHRYHELTPRIQDGGLSLWQCLPDEIWLYILSFLRQADLARLMTVSKGFHRLANDTTLWRYITVKPCYLVSDEALGSIADHKPMSLAMVKCDGSNLSQQALDKFFRDTQDRLKELNVCGCHQGSLVSSVVLETASKYCHGLTHIDMSYCNIRDNPFVNLVNCVDKLESLCVNGFQNMSDSTFLTLVKKHGKSLHTLELYACFSLSANVLKRLGDYCSKLRRLCLGGCNKLTDSTMITMSTCLARVEELDLRGCKNLRNDCIRKIVRNCPRISTLVLANCQQITDAALVEMGTYLKNSLRVVDVCGCNLIGDDGVISLARNCDQLASLDISSTKCTHRSVIHLASSPCSRWLKTLKLSFLTGLTENCLINVIKSCQRLKLVHIFGCASIKNLTKLKAVDPRVCIEGDEMTRLSFQ